jgi:hypothetical protein
MRLLLANALVIFGDRMGTDVNLQRTVSAMSAERDIQRLLIVDEVTGTVVASNHLVDVGQELTALPDGAALAAEPVHDHDKSYHLVHRAMNLPPLPGKVLGRAGKLIVTFDTSFATSVVNRTLATLTLSLAGALGLTILLVWFVMLRSVLLPMQRIMETMSMREQGDLAARVVTGVDRGPAADLASSVVIPKT